MGDWNSTERRARMAGAVSAATALTAVIVVPLVVGLAPLEVLIWFIGLTVGFWLAAEVWHSSVAAIHWVGTDRP